MKIIALDFAAKRIATLDTESDGGGYIDYPTYGLAAGVATAQAFVVSPIVGVSAGASTATASSYDTAAPLEPLWIYPWADGGSGRPVHSRGNTTYVWGDYPSSPASSTDFTTLATAQATAVGAAGDVYLKEAGAQSYNWMGTGWYSISRASGLTVDPLVVLGGPGVTFDNSAEPEPVNPLVSTTDAKNTFQRTGAYLPQGVYTGGSYPANMLVISEGAHVFMANALAAFPSILWLTDLLGYRLLHNGSSGPPGGYSAIPFAQDMVFSGGSWQVSTTWPSYVLCVTAERSPYHPTTKDGFTWVIDTASGSLQAKQLAGVEYRNGYLYQNALGPVVISTDPRYNDSAFWEAERTAAINNGTMRADVAYPVAATQWARAL